jgi:hypothetical protein
VEGVVTEDATLAPARNPTAVKAVALGYRRDCHLAVWRLDRDDPGSGDRQSNRRQAFTL